MGIPVVPIITAVAPVVMRALEHYNRRSEEQQAEAPGSTQQRLQALEKSDLEQAQLLSDLSRQVEELARALEAQVAQQRARDKRWAMWVGLCSAVATVATVIAIIALLR